MPKGWIPNLRIKKITQMNGKKVRERKANLFSEENSEYTSLIIITSSKDSLNYKITRDYNPSVDNTRLI
ncbi:MAG: hypothetical protein STSR0008_15790 [Ignavibacterium sp.]